MVEVALFDGFDSIQSNAIKMALEGKSINLIGKPGTGKTHTTRGIIRQLRAAGKSVLYVTYMWSVACVAGEGCVTIQSIAGGLLDTFPKGRQFKQLCNTLLGHEVLAVEELQTAPVPLMAMFERVCREAKLRNSCL